MTSICGVVCDICKDFGANCPGCAALEGKVYWASYVGADLCPLYDCCVNGKKLLHCGKCRELPCAVYYDTRDPSVSVAEHEKGIQERVEVLRKLG